MDAVLTAAVAEPSASRPAARFYEPELDVLRFCAFVAVFCFHAVPSDYASLVPRLGPTIPAVLQAVRNSLEFGVCMFFLLSSYLITKLLVIERSSTGSIHMRSFYIRRILRIWPLYLCYLLAMWVLGLPAIHVFAPIENGRLLAFLFFSGNIYTGIFGFTLSPILPLWTISIEEQFYIVWPALARTGTAVLRAAAWAFVGLAVVSIPLLQRFTAQPILTVWTSSLVHFQFFALGALVALWFPRLPTWGAGQRVLFALAGIALVLVAAGPLHITDALGMNSPLLMPGYELMAAGVVLMFLAVLGASKGKNNLPKALIYLGKISYGLYVFHELSLQICGRLADHFNIHMGFRTVAGAALTVTLAMLSYRFFEKPFLVLKDKFALVHTRPV